MAVPQGWGDGAPDKSGTPGCASVTPEAVEISLAMVWGRRCGEWTAVFVPGYSHVSRLCPCVPRTRRRRSRWVSDQCCEGCKEESHRPSLSYQT